MGLENLQIYAKIKLLVFSGDSDERSVSGESIFFAGIAGLPALIMFIVTTISAIKSGFNLVSYHLYIESFPVSISLYWWLSQAILDDAMMLQFHQVEERGRELYLMSPHDNLSAT